MQTEGFSPYHAHLHPHDTGSESPTGLHPFRKFLKMSPGGTLDVFIRVMETEGIIRGLFKGLTMNIVKGPLAVGVSFCVYDILKGLAGIEG